jgi:hypothetical protein
MSAPIELELTPSAPLLDADPVTESWPLPLGPVVFDVRSLAERIVEKTRRLLFGEKSV